MLCWYIISAVISLGAVVAVLSYQFGWRGGYRERAEFCEEFHELKHQWEVIKRDR